MTLKAVLFDVDFTLVKPGPDLGPRATRLLGRRFGLELDPTRYAEARAAAVETIERHPELDHDEEVWVLFTERIIRGMGGDSDRAYECAVEMTRAWEHAENFELYEDTLPVLGALREHGLKIGLVSNTGRDLAAVRRPPCAGRGRRGWLWRARKDETSPGDLSVRLDELGLTPRRPRWSATRRRTTSRGLGRSGCAPSSSTAKAGSRRRWAGCRISSLCRPPSV